MLPYIAYIDPMGYIYIYIIFKIVSNYNSQFAVEQQGWGVELSGGQSGDRFKLLKRGEPWRVAGNPQKKRRFGNIIIPHSHQTWILYKRQIWSWSTRGLAFETDAFLIFPIVPHVPTFPMPLPIAPGQGRALTGNKIEELVDGLKIRAYCTSSWKVTMNPPPT